MMRETTSNETEHSLYANHSDYRADYSISVLWYEYCEFVGLKTFTVAVIRERKERVNSSLTGCDINHIFDSKILIGTWSPQHPKTKNS